MKSLKLLEQRNKQFLLADKRNTNTPTINKTFEGNLLKVFVYYKFNKNIYIFVNDNTIYNRLIVYKIGSQYT